MDQEDRSNVSTLERTVSEQSTVSSKSIRSGTATIKGASSRSKSSRLRSSRLSSTASSTIGDGEQSLTSFPDFPSYSRQPIEGPVDSRTSEIVAASTVRPSRHSSIPPQGEPARGISIPSGSISSPGSVALGPTSGKRSPLFDDSPLNGRRVPGALHLADDSHIERQIARQGAVQLVRQIAEDLAQRNAEIAALSRRMGARERALKKMLHDCGFSSLEIETRLKAVERGETGSAGAEGGRRNRRDSINCLVHDAMSESVSGGTDVDLGFDSGMGAATLRATALKHEQRLSRQPRKLGDSTLLPKGASKGWKDLLWGGGVAKDSDDDAASRSRTVIANPRVSDRRQALSDDMFSPPLESASTGSSSRASSTYSSRQGRTTSIASLLRLGGSSSMGMHNNPVPSLQDVGQARGRASSVGQRGSPRSPSSASKRTTLSTRTFSSTTGGPKTLMNITRSSRPAAPRGPVSPAAVVRTQPILSMSATHERREIGSSHVKAPSLGDDMESYGPVEMDTILPAETQPPTLLNQYTFQYPDLLTDRFGFIYDQQRKRRQNEASQSPRHGNPKVRTEMLTSILTGPISPEHEAEEQIKFSAREHVDTVSNQAMSTGKGKSGSTVDIENSRFTSSVQTNDDDNDDEDNDDEADDDHDDDDEDNYNNNNNNGEGSDIGGGEPRVKKWQDYLKIATFPTELLSHTPSINADALKVMGVTPTNSYPGGGRALPARSIINTTITNDSSNGAGLASESKLDDESKDPQKTMCDVEPVKLLLRQLSEVHDALQMEKTTRWNDFLRKVRAERRREAGEAASKLGTAEMPETMLADGEIIGVSGLGNKGKVGRAKWNEFRNLLLGGIPVTYRAKIWSECCGANSLRTPGLYDDLVARPVAKDDPEVVKQIEMDISRTLTDNVFFRRGPGMAKLREVLLAYARRNTDVGYCQGMNLIVANLLLMMPSAEDAFWVLAALVELILPEDYYNASLAASQADQVVLCSFVTEVLPKLSRHLDTLGVELQTQTFSWFLSLFTDCLSAEALFRVWDVVFCTNERNTFLFRVALALLKLNESQLLSCDTPARFYMYVGHKMTNHNISIDGLIQASDALCKLVKTEDVERRRKEKTKKKQV